MTVRVLHVDVMMVELQDTLWTGNHLELFAFNIEHHCKENFRKLSHFISI
jgi:hypothetical protein